jgi:hypothetical protein
MSPFRGAIYKTQLTTVINSSHSLIYYHLPDQNIHPKKARALPAVLAAAFPGLDSSTDAMSVE